MKILVWDGHSQTTEAFLEMAQKYADIDLLEDPLDLAANAGSGDIIVFDLDANKKLVEKAIKKIKKLSVNKPIVVITNNLASQDMSKHQKAKHGADIYLRAPVNESLFINMLRPYVGELASVNDEVERLQARTIISEHQNSDSEGEFTAQAQTTNSQLDQAFREAMRDDDEAARALEEIQKQELDEIDLDGGDEGLIDLGEDDLQSEELDMSEDNSKKLEDTGLDLDEGLELDLGAEDEVSLDSLENEAASEMSLDEGGLELDSADGEDLSLGNEEPEELELGSDEDGISLDLEEDAALELGENTQAEDTQAEDTQAKELSAEDGLELGEETGLGEISEELSLDSEEPLQYDDDNSKMFDLDSTTEEPEELNLSGEMGDKSEADPESLSLEEELDLSGESTDLEDADLFGSEEELGGLLEEGPEEEASELSADSLPDSPDLGREEKGEAIAEEKASAKANTEMSQHALEQLAQIDQIMMRDASQIRKGLKPDATREIDLNELQNDASNEVHSQARGPELNEAGQSVDLVAQLQAEVEEEDYDPTAQEEEEGAQLEGLFTSSPEATSTAIKTSPSLTNISQSMTEPEAEKTINEQKSALMRHEEELIRLGATIKNLREDREELTRQIEEMRESAHSEKRDHEGLRAQLDESRIELEVVRKRAAKQSEEMRYRLALSEDKSRALEEKTRRLELENEKLRGKANIDVSRVRARERELENKLELLKADTETQIRNRDHKILELKRKIDTLEFDIESIQMKEQKTVDSNFAMEERMERVINTLRRAIGELESEEAL